MFRRTYDDDMDCPNVGEPGILSVHETGVADLLAFEYISTVAYTGLSQGCPARISEPFGRVLSAFTTILSALLAESLPNTSPAMKRCPFGSTTSFLFDWLTKSPKL